MSLAALLDGLPIPIIQAPMVGASLDALTVAVSRAGGLGTYALGTLPPADIGPAIEAVRAETDAPFGVNLLMAPKAAPDAAVVDAALARLAPWYQELGAPLPAAPNQFAPDFEAQLAAVIATAPPMASFTFSVLTTEQVRALQAAGTYVVGTATTVAEARAWAAVGADGICAQGFEAGGHRGHFLAETEASLVGTMALVATIRAAVDLPVIAAGGIMDGRGVAAALALGAAAAQMGTAFLLADEAVTSRPWRRAVTEAGDDPTRLSRAFTGRHARGLENRFMRLMHGVEDEVPAYPVQNRLTQPLRAAASAADDPEMLSLWAGQAVKLAQPGAAGEMVRRWWAEAQAAAAELSARTRSAAEHGGGGRLSDLRTAAREAFVYTLPLIEVATTRQRGMGLGQRMNGFTHIRSLANQRHRAVTTPNTDTLYSTAHIDLSAGPVTIVLPGMGERYVSLALMDAYTNNFAILGTRTSGPDGVTFRLVGPGEAADGGSIVRSPTNHAWALARILVEGPHDLEAAREAQAGISMQGPACDCPGPYAARTVRWAEYFASAAALMAANPPGVTDLGVLRAMAPLGLTDGFDPGRFTAAQVAEIEAGLEEGRVAVRGGGGLAGGAPVDGWTYPTARLGDFGQDYGLRGTVALGGLAALPPVEAMYMQAHGPGAHGLYDGTKAWRLHVPPDAPIPVNSFWSLSLYEAMDDGQFFFCDNPLVRYAIGDRTPGLTKNADGSLDIWMGHADPGGERSANWLPAPAGPFALFLRAYLPKPELLDGRYRLPPVQAA